MTGIAMPHDRTCKQQALAVCFNPECRSEPDDTCFEFTVENDHFACPKCGANKAPLVDLRTLTHLLIRDRAGLIVGEGGLQFKIACDPKRRHLATMTNEEAATDQRSVANCPQCLASVPVNFLPTGYQLFNQRN